MMRLPNSAQTSRPWRIQELTRDFRLEDVWALPGGGAPDDFDRLVQMIASLDPSHSASCAVRALFAIRWRIGELLGWDGPDSGVGSRVPTLRDRLPADLRDAPSGPDFDALPATSLYLLDNDRRGLDCWGHRRATPSDLIELRRAGARVTGVPGVWLARLATGLPEFVISVYGAAHPGRDRLRRP